MSNFFFLNLTLRVSETHWGSPLQWGEGKVPIRLRRCTGPLAFVYFCLWKLFITIKRGLDPEYLNVNNVLFEMVFHCWKSHKIPMHVKHTLQLNIQFPKLLLGLVKMRRRKKSVSQLLMKRSSQRRSFWTLELRVFCFVSSFLFSFVLFYFRNTISRSPGWPWTRYVAKDGFELIFLPLPPKCRNHRCALPCWFSSVSSAHSVSILDNVSILIIQIQIHFYYMVSTPERPGLCQPRPLREGPQEKAGHSAAFNLI